MEQNITLILAVPPAQLQAAQAYGLSIAHMAYRIGAGCRLLRGALSPDVRGGLMYLSDQSFVTGHGGDSQLFAREVLRECAARGYSGVMADWEQIGAQEGARLLGALSQGLERGGLTLFVPEPWGRHCPLAQVMISSALSGGSLRARLEDAMKSYGCGRVCLAVERCAEEFILPSPRGTGTPLSPEELAQRRHSHNPATYFSPELCAHYFTWQGQDGQARFVLFDTESSVRRKLHTARQLGIHQAVLAYPNVAELLPGILR